MVLADFWEFCQHSPAFLFLRAFLNYPVSIFHEVYLSNSAKREVVTIFICLFSILPIVLARAEEEGMVGIPWSVKY